MTAPPTPLARWLPLAALILLTCAWGVTWVLVKQGLAYAQPLDMAAQRTLGGALALFIALKLTGRPLGLVGGWQTVAIGVIQVSGYLVFQIWALVEGGAGKTAVLVFTMPIWTLLLAWPILGERIRGKQWLAAASTLTGLVLIIEPWNLHISLFSKFLSLMAALCWAVGTILFKRLATRQPVDVLVQTAWQTAIGAVPLAVLALVVPERATEWTLSYLGILGFMSIVSVALCSLLWIYILDRLPAWEASLSVLGTPVVAILSSRMMFGEEFKASEIGGILLIGSGLALLSFLGWLSSRRTPSGLPPRHPDFPRPRQRTDA